MNAQHPNQYTLIIPTLWKGSTAAIEHAIQSVLADSASLSAITVHIIVFLNGASVAEQQDVSHHLKKNYTKRSTHLTVLFSERNKGFTGAVNEALFWARIERPSRWYVILNDDAYIRAGFFAVLRQATKQKNTALISCAVEHVSGKAESCGLTYQRTGLAFPDLSGNAESTQRLACGTCLAFSDTFVEQEVAALGFVLNPLFFAYAEDVEVSLRARMSSKKIVLISTPLVVHHGSRTAGRASELQLYHGYRNLLLCILLLWSPWTMVKHLPWLLIGQLYVLVVLLSKGYILVYPRILWYVLKNFSEIMTQRYVYKYHYGHLYSVSY